MTHQVTCPNCRVEIPPDDINVGEGVAFCRACDGLHRLTDIHQEPDPPIPEITPSGCGVDDDGVQTIVRADIRSFRRALPLLIIAGFLNGILSLFILVAIGASLLHLLSSVPSWVPAPRSESGEPALSVGIAVLLWIFLMPFIVGCLAVLGVALTILLGRVDVRIRSDRGMVRTGFGTFVWRRRFSTSTVRSVELGETTWRRNLQARPAIVIEVESGRKIRLGSSLTEERRTWMLAVLRQKLMR